MSHSFGSFTWFTSFHWTNSIAYLNQSSKTDVDLCVTTRDQPPRKRAKELAETHTHQPRNDRGDQPRGS